VSDHGMCCRATRRDVSLVTAYPQALRLSRTAIRRERRSIYPSPQDMYPTLRPFLSCFASKNFWVLASSVVGVGARCLEERLSRLPAALWPLFGLAAPAGALNDERDGAGMRATAGRHPRGVTNRLSFPAAVAHRDLPGPILPPLYISLIVLVLRHSPCRREGLDPRESHYPGLHAQ